MPPYRLTISARVFAILRDLTPPERQAVRQIIDSIQADPSADNIHKTRLFVPPLVFGLYETDAWWVVYHVRGDGITIDNIGRPSGTDSGTPRPSPPSRWQEYNPRKDTTRGYTR